MTTITIELDSLMETLLALKCLRLARTEGAATALKALDDVRQYEARAPGIYERVNAAILETVISEGRGE